MTLRRAARAFASGPGIDRRLDIYWRLIDVVIGAPAALDRNFKSLFLLGLSLSLLVPWSSY